MKKVLLTSEAVAKLESRLKELIEKRQIIAEEIKVARSFGDLSENAEYDAAREAQAINESEINKIKDSLDNYELVEPKKANARLIGLNSKVEFQFEGDDDVKKVTIVTRVDSNPIKGFISNESPIGEALIGKKKGSEVNCVTPSGVKRLKVLSVTNKK